MNRKLSLMLSMLMLLAIDIQGQTTKGTYSFMDVTNSARVAALGGTMLPIYDTTDVQLAIYNPSVIDKGMHNALALSYVNYYAGMNFATVQYSRTFRKAGSFAATVQYHNYGTMNYADATGTLTGGTFTPSDYLFTIGWGRRLTPRWSIGANVKFGGIQHEAYKTFAVAADVALHYHSKSGWMMTVGARNAGVETYDNIPGNVRNKLPFHLSAGVAKRLEHVPFLISIMYDDIQSWKRTYDDPLDLEGNYDPISGEYRKKSGVGEFADNFMRHIVFGGELYVGKHVVLRLGFNYGRRQDLKTPAKKGMCGFSYGVGINVWKFTINYSRSEMHIYGSPNYVTITTNLDRFIKGGK
ncbi:MAG: type IX secretion system protein PorQ [Bacteroidales bacterium]|nr:type IX secretion system protein PorQ [Bacteroidales bacterium]